VFLVCKGISILRVQFPVELFAQYDLSHRIVSRGGEQHELHFLYVDRAAALPVLHNGQLVIYEWGNRNKKSKLPHTGWCSNESLEAGKWRWLEPELVEIPAHFGLEKGVWFQIVQGVRGVLVKDEKRRPHVYMLTKPASHYYEIMTRCNRMPVLIEQDI
jgi:hypothetical protein